METLQENGSARGCPIDFDHHSAEHAENWVADFAQLHENCPRAWSKNHGGYWIATKFKDVVAIAQRPESFTAHKSYNIETGVVSGGVSIPVLPGIRGIPNETESPEWNEIRGFINRRFAPKAVEAYRTVAEGFAAALIDAVIETGEIDLVNDLTNPLPALVTMHVFGFPLGDWRAFSDPFHKIMYTSRDDPNYNETIAGLDYFFARLEEEVALRRSEPQEDLLTHLATGMIDGRPLEMEEIRNLAFNLLAGGVDTTTALTSNTLLYLSKNPLDREHLIANRAALPVAREEFVRFFSPIHGLARNVIDDVDVDGWNFERGDKVLLAYAAANRDPSMFEDPHLLKIDRFPNRHVGFGAGMHRCVGSFLARIMFEVMVNEVLDRIPDYKVIEDESIRYPSVGTVNGWISLPATFTPGSKREDSATALSALFSRSSLFPF